MIDSRIMLAGCVPDVPLSSKTFHLLMGNPEAFLDQMRSSVVIEHSFFCSTDHRRCNTSGLLVSACFWRPPNQPSMKGPLLGSFLNHSIPKSEFIDCCKKHSSDYVTTLLEGLFLQGFPNLTASVGIESTVPCLSGSLKYPRHIDAGLMIQPVHHQISLLS